ncbi:hypothetical protein D3C80_1433860 [compost metagenome]
MLSADLGQIHALEVGVDAQDADVGVALSAHHGGVGLVLHEQGNILADKLVLAAVPVVKVGMGYDHRVDARHHLLCRHRQIH